jgi:hypothetical protein
MEPTNRPYVDPATEPGDAGTEPWTDDGAGAQAEDPTKRRSAPDPVAPSEEGAAIKGSPADQFLTDDDAVSARNEERDQPAGDWLGRQRPAPIGGPSIERSRPSWPGHFCAGTVLKVADSTGCEHRLKAHCSEPLGGEPRRIGQLLGSRFAQS